MRIAKVYNNSVVLATDDRGVEYVLLGRGIGFQARPGDVVDPLAVDKRFVPGGAASVERLAAYLDEIPLADIELTEEIVRAARADLGPHVGDHVLLPLADHISFALRRAKEGAGIDYPLRWEVTALYPAEVAFARKALKIVARRRGVRLPEMEAVPLALHLVNAQFGAADISDTVRMTEVFSDALALVANRLRAHLDEESVNVARFAAHLRFLFLRRRDGNRPVESDIGLREAVRVAKPAEYDAAVAIGELLRERFDWTVGEDEVLYLALHVSRLTAGLAGRG